MVRPYTCNGYAIANIKKVRELRASVCVQNGTIWTLCVQIVHLAGTNYQSEAEPENWSLETGYWSLASSLAASPNFSSLVYSILRVMPSSFAALDLLPPALRIASLSMVRSTS